MRFSRRCVVVIRGMVIGVYVCYVYLCEWDIIPIDIAKFGLMLLSHVGTILLL